MFLPVDLVVDGLQRQAVDFVLPFGCWKAAPLKQRGPYLLIALRRSSQFRTYRNCSRRLTKPPLTSEEGGGSSYFWWFLLSLQVIESGSVETEGTLPVDCTPTIKSVLG